MKPIAENACRDLANQIFECRLVRCLHIVPAPDTSEQPIWKRADRIERRFRCIGATDYFLDRMLLRQKQFLADESQRHDNQQPDRRTYLHR